MMEEYHDWVKNEIEYNPIEDFHFRYDPIEEAAERHDCKPIDIVGTLMFDQHMPMDTIEEGNQRIGSGSNEDPWRYKCILKQLVKTYTLTELAEKFPVQEKTIRKHAKDQSCYTLIPNVKSS